MKSPLPGVPLWDAAWVKQTFGLDMRELPNGWQKWPSRMDEMLKEINRYEAKLWEEKHKQKGR